MENGLIEYEDKLPIIWEIVEQVLDNFYFCYNPGHDGTLFHLSDDSFIGFTLDIEKDELVLFNLYDCEFSQDENGKYSTEGMEEWKYPIPKTFSEFIDLLNKHELLFDNEGYENDKDELLNSYSKHYHNQTFKPFHQNLAKKYNLK